MAEVARRSDSRTCREFTTSHRERSVATCSPVTPGAVADVRHSPIEASGLSSATPAPIWTTEMSGSGFWRAYEAGDPQEMTAARADSVSGA